MRRTHCPGAESPPFPREQHRDYKSTTTMKSSGVEVTNKPMRPLGRRLSIARTLFSGGYAHLSVCACACRQVHMHVSEEKRQLDIHVRE